MKRDNAIFTILFWLTILVLISFATGFILFFAGRTGLVLLFAVIGIAGFFLILAGNSLMGKSSDKEKNHQYYTRLVDKAEKNKKAFEKKIKRLIFIGNLYTALILLILLCTILCFILLTIARGRITSGFTFFIIGLGGLAGVILKSLYIKSEEIKGHEITPFRYPGIYKVITRAREKTDAPLLHKILVYPDANCGVSRLPVGFGFKSQNVMYVGLYLLYLFDEEELEAVFVHELAHIYNKDTLLTGKAEKSITRWTKIAESCDQRNFVAVLLILKFANFYIAKLQCHLSAISKRQEYLADTEAAKHSGSGLYFRAMAKLELIYSYLDKPSEDTSFNLRRFDAPPKNVYNLMLDDCVVQIMRHKEEWLKQIAKRISTKYDSHPSFNERMTNIGIEDLSFDVSFDNKIDKRELESLIALFNEEWYEAMIPDWEEFCGDYKKSLELVEKYKPTDDAEQNCEYGLALESLGRNSEALLFYNKQLETCPDNEVFHFRKGLILLNNNDEAGIDFVKYAMEKNSNFINSGLQIIGGFLNANGMQDKKETMRDWAMKMAELGENKQEELESLKISDVFIPPNIDGEKLIQLKNSLAEVGSVKRAFLVSKQLKYSDGDLLVLAVVSKGKTIQNVNELARILEEAALPHFLLDLNVNLSFIKPLSKVKNSEIYRT